MQNYTTYKIGGPAKYFFIAKTKDNLLSALKEAKNFKLPVFIMGGGSNILVSDSGFKGIVIKIDISDIDFENNKAVVGAGVNLMKLARLSADKSLSGLEWAGGVPGTVGGAIYGHAQAFCAKISDVIESVECLDIKTFEAKTLTKAQCQFSLKSSIFKENKDLIIISAVLEFKPGNTEEIKNKIEKYLEYRKAHHPVEFSSCGSTFVNPEVKIQDIKLLEKFPQLREFNEKGAIPAGFLIEKSGLSGKKKGGAQISAKHSNFFINTGGATAKDILYLIKLAQKEVKKTFRISLEPEVQFVS